METFEETIAKQQKEIESLKLKLSFANEQIEFLNKQIKSYQNLIHISIGMLDDFNRDILRHFHC